MAKKLLTVLLVCVCIFTACSNTNQDDFKTADEKSFTLCISAPTENVDKDTEYTTEYVYLGDFLEAEGIIGFEKSTYGRYVHDVDGILDNPDENLWWTVYVDEESALTGVDDIKIESGKIYKLELTQID